MNVYGTLLIEPGSSYAPLGTVTVEPGGDLEVLSVNPVNITYGTPLVDTQLSGGAATVNGQTLAGTFTYTSAEEGSLLSAGNGQTEQVTFIPSDATDYGTVTMTITVNVAQATPTVIAANESTTYNGSPQAYPVTGSDVTVSGPNGLTSSGGTLSFTYNGSSTVPDIAGTYSVLVTFAPNDTTDFTSGSTTATWIIEPAKPIITWANPSAIAFFTALSGSQLDATASVPGTFDYTPPAGTLLSAGTHALSVTFTPTDGIDYTTATATVQVVVLAPGVTVIGSQLYCVGGNTSNDQVQVNPAGGSNTGSTGVKLKASLNGVNIQTTYSQSFTTIDVFLQGGNDNIQLANSLTIGAVLTAGNGNDNVQLGNGNNAVTLGKGNDNIQAGNGSNTVTAGGGNDNVTLGNGSYEIVVLGSGNDNVQAGNGSNAVTVGNGNDNIHLGNGNNVVVEGNGNDNIQAGNGDNLIVGGLGKHTIQVGNGSNILIDGSVQLTQSGDSLAQVLSDWALYGASDATDLRARLHVTYNTSNSNTLDAGSGLDWFWAVYAHDHTNRKTTDLLN